MARGSLCRSLGGIASSMAQMVDIWWDWKESKKIKVGKIMRVVSIRMFRLYLGIPL